MADIKQIRIGNQMTGIVGLEKALSEVAASGAGLDDDALMNRLIKRLDKQNYIPPAAIEKYKGAFLREFKKFMGEPVEELSNCVLDIKVLGAGCPSCDQLTQDVMTVIAETGLEAGLEHVRDPVEISRYPALGLPALVINGKVVSSGPVLSRADIKQIIQKI